MSRLRGFADWPFGRRRKGFRGSVSSVAGFFQVAADNPISKRNEHCQSKARHAFHCARRVVLIEMRRYELRRYAGRRLLTARCRP